MPLVNLTVDLVQDACFRSIKMGTLVWPQVKRLSQLEHFQVSQYVGRYKKIIHRTEKDDGCTFYHNTLRT